MAEVFLAKKPGAEGTYKLLVLKRILPMHGSSRRFRAMFIEEARLATRLNHPNVVQVYELQDFGDDGLLLAMEYVEGCDLGKLMRAVKSHDSRIPPWHAAWVVAEAAKGLHYAHERKDEKGLPLDIVHRDVSPQNILVSFDGAVKIADFGIASGRELADDQGVLKGKFGYMSPEQARGEPVDRRSDLYALGVILWELLAGRPLHGGLGGEALLDIVRSGIVEPPAAHAKEVPPELADISMKALSPERADRYATGRELAAAVARELARQGSLPDVGAFDNTVGQLVSRAVESEPLPSRPDSVERSDDVRTQAAVPHARSSVPPHSNPNLGGVAIEPSPAESPGHEPREVRHVAVIALRLSDLERASKHRRFEHLRSMLDHLAFKRGARWAWDNNGGARAIVGLGANAARAALDAAYLALDTHEALSGSNEDPELPLAAAIGIVRGIASGTRDPQGHLVRYTLHRPTELLADVLERATAIAQTWVAGGLYRLVRRDFVWSDLPSLELDPGLGPDVPISMRVYALHRSLSPEERNAAQPGGAGDLVGRDAEKADLHAAFHQAVHGRTQSGQLSCRAIVGEMGIGKSAVVEAFLEELPAETRSVRIECTPVGTEIPFSALAGLVRNAVGASGEEPIEDVAALVAKIGGAAAGGDPTNPIVMRLAELATNRRSGGGDEDAYARRRSILSAFRNLLAAIALERPIVVVVDGMQWADRPSIEVLCEFVRGADPLPILALLVTRPDEHIMPALEGIMRVELTGLSVDEQVRLVGAHLGVSDGVQHACSDLLTRAGGNPFFLLELIDALLERGALEIRETEEVEGKKVASLERTDREDVSFRALPSTLEQLLADRLAELPALEHSIVDWLAIAGGPLSLSDVLELSGVKDPETIDRLGARGVCDRRGELVDFRHPLARDVAYAALDPMDRVRMHRQLGERLSRTSLARGLSAAIVARHLARGESYERAAEFYLEAATAAREGHQNQLVVRYCNRALSYLGPDDKRRVEVHEALESIYRVLGRRRERAWHLEALRRGVRRVANARAVCLGLLRSARFDLDEGHLSRGAEIARQATEVAHAAKIDVLKVEAEALTSNLLRELGDVQGAVAACDRALAAFESPSVSKIPPLLEAEVLRSRGILLRRVGRIREAVDSYLDAIAISRKCGARRMEARVKNALAYAMFVQGRYEDAVALALESIQIDLSMGGRFQLAKTLTTVGQSYFRLGDVRRSLAYLAHARKVHEMYRDQDGWAETLLVSAHVAVELGDFDSAETFVRDASAHTTATGNAYEKVYQEVIEALVSRESRLPSDAVRHSIAARQDAERASLVAFHFLAMAIEAMARVDLGEMHTAILLATTALGAVENLQGCEYGLEIRSFCADALKRAGSPQAPGAHQRAVDHATAMMLAVRDARLRGLFPRRPLHATLFETTSVPTHSLDDGSLASPAGAPRTS